MPYDSMGFIGGGRITRIILTALQRMGRLPRSVIVSDADPAVLDGLQKRFPFLVAAGNDNAKPASCDLVFISLHPPVIVDTLLKIKSEIKQDTVVVSLAPKITLSTLTAVLDRHARIVRMIPNAPAVVNSGYNPVAFSRAIPAEEKPALLKLFETLGRCPEVPEETLEAYAIIAAMGPTYFWFQWQKLIELARSFGLPDADSDQAVAAMLKGAVDTMFGSSLAPDEVMDLVPVKPLAGDEDAIRMVYESRLTALFNKLKS
jgi:pyrroline-5-carboxylate reductase